MAFTSPEETLAAGLVDTLLYMDGTKDYLKQLMGGNGNRHLKVLSINDVKNIQKNVPLDKSGNIIAMYYAEGQIVEKATAGINTTPEIVGEKVCIDLRKLRDDDNVKAVVLRVNSPGGSAYGSEQIWHEVLLLTLSILMALGIRQATTLQL